MRISDWSSDVCSSDLSTGKKVTRMMRLLVAMVVLLFVLGLIFAPSASQESSSADPEPRTLAVSATPVAEEAGQVGNGIAKVVIPRSEDGHFYADAQVGAATVHFLIDTGEIGRAHV